MNDNPSNFVKIGNYRISRADDRNLQVDEFRLVKAKPGRYVKEARETEKWVRRGYFPNVVVAAKGILRYMNEDSVDVDGAKCIVELIDAVEKNARIVEDAVKNSSLETSDFSK